MLGLFKINLFIYLLKYYIVVCTRKECKYTILPIYINSYLSSLYYNYNQEQYIQIIQKVQQIPELIQDRRGLQLFQFPELRSIAIPKLRAV